MAGLKVIYIAGFLLLLFLFACFPSNSKCCQTTWNRSHFVQWTIFYFDWTYSRCLTFDFKIIQSSVNSWSVSHTIFNSTSYIIKKLSANTRSIFKLHFKKLQITNTKEFILPSWASKPLGWEYGTKRTKEITVIFKGKDLRCAYAKELPLHLSLTPFLGGAEVCFSLMTLLCCSITRRKNAAQKVQNCGVPKIFLAILHLFRYTRRLNVYVMKLTKTDSHLFGTLLLFNMQR